MAQKNKAAKTGREIVIAPSILASDLGRLADEVRAVERAGADWIHIDVMDGRFVPNLTWGPPIVKAVRKATSLPLDVHLMIVEPEKYIDAFAAAGADVITIHAETCPHLHRSVEQIQEAGQKLSPKRRIRAGVALNPSTSLTALDYVLPDLDSILIMTVNPGFGGQSFIPQSLEKISELTFRLYELGLSIPIQVDGGVTLANIPAIASAGATNFVAGTTVFGAKDYKKIIKDLRQAAKV
jgi:ribulose-phosphate 3-epimerase